MGSHRLLDFIKNPWTYASLASALVPRATAQVPLVPMPLTPLDTVVAPDERPVGFGEDVYTGLMPPKQVSNARDSLLAWNTPFETVDIKTLTPAQRDFVARFEHPSLAGLDSLTADPIDVFSYSDWDEKLAQMELYRNDIGRGDVVQSVKGVCYAAAAFAVLANQRPDVIQNAIVTHAQDSTLPASCDGIAGWGVRLRTWSAEDRATTWKTIPVLRSDLISESFNLHIHSRDNMELWPLVVEAALAKVIPDYDRGGGLPHDVLAMLTGGLGKSMTMWEFSPTALPGESLSAAALRWMRDELQQGTLLALGTVRAFSREEQMNMRPGQNGVAYLQQHAYAVLEAEVRGEDLWLKVQEPQGISITPSQDSISGSFWVSPSDFAKYFNLISYCRP